MGYSVAEESVFNGYHHINDIKPKVFFITNTVGADINFNLMKYAKKIGINGASLISEGNFTGDDDLIGEFIWGWNTDKILYEDIHMQWSKRARELTLKMYPLLEEKVKISGGVGFDLYKIGVFVNKNRFLVKYSKKKFEKIIGVGCWDFGLLYPDDPRFAICDKFYSKTDRDRFIRDQRSFNDILRHVVANNPRILFLLKEHPGCLGGRNASAIEGLESFPNTLILKNEESIKDCINVSDFWISYESTTALEAWLLNKQTCLLNPSGTDFKRANVYLGSPNYPTEEILQQAIEKFYNNGELPGFKELEGNRHNIIKDTIQWDDGLNHVRAGNEIIDLIDDPSKPKNTTTNFHYTKEMYRQLILWHLSPYLCFQKRFAVYADHRRAFNKKQLREFQDKCMKEQIDFYKKKNLNKEDLRMIRCI
jgi:hypothetical protein